MIEKARRIRAVFFDLDGTLVHVADAGPRHLARVYRSIGLTFTASRIGRHYRRVERAWERSHPPFVFRPRSVYVDFNRRMLRQLGVSKGLQRKARLAVDAWDRLAAAGAERLYPDVRATLDALKKRGLRMAVVTHRPLVSARQTLRRLGIARCFRTVIAPDMLGISRGKLTLRFWGHALKKVGVGAGQAVHVDNEYECGIRGTRRAGITAILIVRRRLRPARRPCPTIRSLKELPRWLGKKVKK